MNARLTAAGLVSAMVLIGSFEGIRYAAYKDPTGTPTICFGSTAWAGGDTKRPEECAGLLARDVLEAARVLDCVSAELTPGQQAAIVSLAYNAGVSAICGSTLVRMANEGRPPQEWCNQFSRWVYSRGVKLPGLVKRRAEERALCLS